MSTKTESYANPLSAAVPMNEVVDSTTEQREVTIDGYTYHYGPNEKRNFLDESVGQRAAAFRTDGIVESDDMGSSRF